RVRRLAQALGDRESRAMSVLAASPPAAAPTANATRQWFAGAAALVALHWLDVALVDRWPGQSVRAGAPAAIAAGLFAAAGVLAVVLAVNWLVLPAGFALYATGKPASAVPAGALGLPHQNVGFAAADGVRLAGWHVPSRNRAAILLVHGGGGSRAGAVRHA